MAIAFFNRSMSVRTGKSDKATSRNKGVRSTDISSNPSLSFNVAVAGTCAHHRPQLARPLMSLILGVLLIPLFSRVYTPRQPISFSIVLLHLQLFTVDVVSLFWSKCSVLSRYYTNPLPVTHSSTSGTLSADSKRTQSRGPCSLSLPR